MSAKQIKIDQVTEKLKTTFAGVSKSQQFNLPAGNDAFLSKQSLLLTRCSEHRCLVLNDNKNQFLSTSISCNAAVVVGASAELEVGLKLQSYITCPSVHLFVSETESANLLAQAASE